MNLKEKLETILQYKDDIKNSLINKGSDIDDSTPLSGYAEKIDNLPTGDSEVEEWTPDPEWWDIKTILDNDTNDEVEDEILNRCEKYIVLKEAIEDSNSFDLSISPLNNNRPYAIKMSDGGLYRASESLKVNHTWDKSKDKPWGNSATRYLIFYYDTEGTYELPLWALSRGGYDLYYYFKIKIGSSLSSEAFNICKKLRAIDLAEGYDFKNINFSKNGGGGHFQQMYSVRHIPTDLSLYPDDVSVISFAESPCLLKLPVKFGQSTDLASGFSDYGNRASIDAEIDISTVDASILTSANVFTSGSNAPRKIKGILDFTNYTLTSLNLFNNPMSRTMTKCKIILPSTCSNITIFGGYNTSIYNTFAGLLDDESIIFMAENAPVVTSCTLNFPVTYLAKIRDMKDKIEYNGAEYTVYELFKAKGYSFNKESEWF